MVILERKRRCPIQPVKATKLIFKNHFDSPPLELNYSYEYIDYSKASTYTLNTFIRMPITKQSQHVERHEERRQHYGQFTATCSKTGGHTHTHTESLSPRLSPEDKHIWRDTS